MACLPRRPRYICSYPVETLTHLYLAAFVKPYILSILPPGTLPNPSDKDVSTVIASPVVQVVSSITQLPVQLLTISTGAGPIVSNTTLRLLTVSASASVPLYFVSTPSDRHVTASEGSSVWRIQMRSWGEQVDELVDSESYEEALALLETIDKALLPDRVGSVSAKFVHF